MSRRQPEIYVSTNSDLVESSSAIFIGEVRTRPLDLKVSDADSARAAYVRFAPGAHTSWHVHSSDQVLIVAEGSGHIGTPDRDYRATAGSVVRIPGGVVHYHGAAADTPFAHVAVLSGDTEVLDLPLAWPPAEAVD